MTFGRRTPKKSTEQRVIEDVILGYDIALEEIGMLEGYFEKHPVSHVGADHPYDEAASHRYLERLEEIRVTITARRAEVALDTADYAQLAIEALALGDELERLNGMTSVVVEEDDFFYRGQALSEGGAYGLPFAWAHMPKGESQGNSNASN